jgi:hypothetical protein
MPGMKETEERLPPPQRMEYTQAEYLQSIELVKQGFRRAIQAAPARTSSRRRRSALNDKSGTALEHIDDAATKGTWHFVDAYEEGIRAGGVILEDLIDKTYDYTGETATMSAKFEAQTVRINDPQDPQAVSTYGDHLVTVSTAPSSDSEYDAAEKFIELMIGNLGEIAQICRAAGRRLHPQPVDQDAQSRRDRR